MVTAEPNSRQLVLSETQRSILQSIVRKTHCPQAIAVRTRIMSVAVEKPEECGRPISHWSSRELADEARQRGIVEKISPRHVARFLKKWTSGPTSRVTG
jgi:hypothetical protein